MAALPAKAALFTRMVRIHMTKKRLFFTEQDLNDILNGSMLLGCGGGGSRNISEFFLKTCILPISNKIKYMDPRSIPPSSGDMAAVFSLMGFPKMNVPVEILGNAMQQDILKEGLMKVYKLMKEKTGASLIFPISIETGAFSIFTSMFLSLMLDIPVIDCDCGGRAFPKIDMCTFAASEINPSPTILSAIETDLHVEISCDNCVSVDEICRSIISNDLFYVPGSGTGKMKAYGGFAAQFPTNLTKAKDSVVANTITKSRDIGRTIRENATDPVGAVIREHQGYELISGRISRIDLRSENGYCCGTVEIKSHDNIGETAVIKCFNENFIIWSDKKNQPLAMAPDLICYMSPDGKALSNSDIEEGSDISIIGFKADPKLLAPYTLNSYQNVLKYLGYCDSYKPINMLML